MWDMWLQAWHCPGGNRQQVQVPLRFALSCSHFAYQCHRAVSYLDHLDPIFTAPLGFFRGAAKKKIDGPPRTLNKSPTHPPTIRLFFFLTFFFSTFSGVSRQGEFKNTIKIFLQKVHVENVFEHFDKNFDVSFSATFFVLSRFRVFLSDGSSKTLQKRFCKTNRLEKFLQKNRPKIQNRLFLDFFLSRVWAFLDDR
jgi:hypothetical protein